MRKKIEEFIDKNYIPHKYSPVPVSGKVFDKEELANLIEASMEGWWTEGRWTELFEQKLKDFLGVKFIHSCNSGSSANLLAFSALCSHTLGERRIKKGDEVITVAAGFPTTVNPIIQNGCVPVFVDVDRDTYEIDVTILDKALSPKTKAVMIAHSLGNPFDVRAVLDFCRKNKLWLIEDNCDALGSRYDGKITGTFGDISTFSFYPAHHITTAEGGAVATNSKELSTIIRSVRDWGRHCWCPTGKDNTCKNRFNWQLGKLPKGYDHKYIYGEIGFNLKLSDLHAAIGVAQMDKLSGFIKKRRENFKKLYNKLQKFEDCLSLPQATENSEPSWFGFLIGIKDDSINREDLMRFLESKKIGTRLLFAGNLTKQPYFTTNAFKYRQIGDLPNTDFVMTKVFWIGLFPGVTDEMIDEIEKAFGEYFHE